MGAVSYSSVIVTIFSYIQRLGIAANLPGIKVPDTLKNVLIVFVNMYNTIEAAFPDIPDFDFRSQLVILGVGIPILLDIIFVWFIYPFYGVIMHILDIVGMFSFAYFLTTGIVVGFDSVTTTWTIVSLVFIVSRLFLMFYGKSKSNDQLFDLVRSICNYFMGNIIPQSENTITFKELSYQIHKFSKLVEVAPERVAYWKSAIWFVLGFILIVAGYFCLGMFCDPGFLPEVVRIIVPTVCLPIGFLCWLSFMLQMFYCGRKFIVSVKQFVRRWGLKLLLMMLDIMYIPIIQCLVYHLTPSEQGCDPNYYLYIERNPKYFFDPFVNKSVECLPCARKVTGVCVERCSGIKELRMKSSPALLFMDDVWGIMGGVVVYTLVVIMVGIPLIWYFLVKRNTGFVKNINVYGASASTKWLALTNRLHTTGIFIFEDFKHDKSYWCVLLLVMKLIQMLIEVVSEVMIPEFCIVLPIYYAISAVITIIYKPYVNLFNTIFEVILESINAIFAIISVFSFYGYVVPESFTLPLSVLFLGVPVVSLFFIVFIQDEKGTINDETDPTLIRKALTQTIKDDKELPNIYDANRSDMERLLISNSHEIEEAHDNISNEKLDSKLIDIDVDDEEKPKDQDNDLDDGTWEVANCDDEHVIIEFGLLDTIGQVLDRENSDKVGPDTQSMYAFEVKKDKLAKLMTKMYDTLDTVLDGSTIEILTHVLDIVVLFGSAATGWYLGALFAQNEKTTDIICG